MFTARHLSTIFKVITGRTGRKGRVPLNEKDLSFWVIAGDAYLVMYGLLFKYSVLNHQISTSETQEHAAASGKCVYSVIPHDTDEWYKKISYQSLIALFCNHVQSQELATKAAMFATD